MVGWRCFANGIETGMPVWHRSGSFQNRRWSQRPSLTAAFVLVAMAAFVPAAAPARAQAESTIYVLVNDQPISAYKVSQRAALIRMTSGGGDVTEKLKAKLKSPGIQDQFRKFAMKHNPQSKEDVLALQKKFIESLRQQLIKGGAPGGQDKALAQLVNEKLQMQEAKRLDVLATDEDVETTIATIAKKNGKSVKEFEAMLGSQGVRGSTFRDKLRAQISWQRVLSRRFRGQVNVAESELDNAMALGGPVADNGEAGKPAEIVQMGLQRILIPQPGKLDGTVMATNYENAEKLHRQAKGCKNMSALAKQVEGAKFENLGKVGLDTLSEQVRPILANANPGDVPPPVLTASGIEIYAVCDREIVAATEQTKNETRARIEQTKLEALSKGLLSDLCASAFIEYRNGMQAKKQCGSE